MYSFEEKVACVKILIDIAGADGEVSDSEVAYGNQILTTFKFNSSKEVAEFIRDEASELTATDAMRMMAQMNVEKKTMMALMMAEMVYADGSTDPNELDILTSVLAAMFSVGPAQE